MKSNSPIEVNVDKITESCAEVDGDEDLLSPLCTNTEDTEDRSVVDGESYESQAARTVSFGERLCHTVPVYKGNTMLQWPKSTFFTPNKVMTARSVFNALVNANIDISEIHCLQWKLNGEVVVTSKTIATKEKFLRLNLLKVNSENYTLQDIDKPLTFLTIYNVPFELSDLGIIKHLAAFCEVLHIDMESILSPPTFITVCSITASVSLNLFPIICGSVRPWGVRLSLRNAVLHM